MELSQDNLSIEEVNRRSVKATTLAVIRGQIAEVAVKMTREQKRYLGLLLRDLSGSFLLRVWNDHPLYSFCSELRVGDLIALAAEFGANPPFGCEARNWTIRFLNPEEIAVLVAGPPEFREKLAQEYGYIQTQLTTVKDPRLRALGVRFLEEFGDRFRRTAGARHYHHARRGGLVEHVAQMFRAVDALSGVYPALNRDLLLVGVLLHDVGKMWENCYSKDSLTMPFDSRGELLGHIPIGIEVINRLWSQLRETPEFQPAGSPEAEAVRLHLLHLVAAHHGAKEFGSPVEPKTPEAFALHFIDNLDAKLDVLQAAYRTGHALSDQIIERVRPLSTNVVVPLPPYRDDTASGPDAFS